ncbi:MAG: hypothetical protein Q4C98_03685 [Capnocytophaga sp.]|nr:hypothetical protein [Capnocytophaga sp.]
MNINILNGNVHFGQVLITKEISRDEMQNRYPKAEIWDVKTGSFWLYFHNIALDELIWQVSVCYFHQALKMIVLEFRHSSEKPFSWEDWSEESELAQLKRYQNWIAEHIGTQTQFDWGKIEATYNPKDGTSKIVLSYH